MDSAIFRSVKLDDVEVHKTFSQRPSDAEGPSNHALLLAELGLNPEQVLSPSLGSGGIVTVISSEDDIQFHQEKGRLQPVGNDGSADGWIITDKSLVKKLAFEGAVADCPMVTAEFYDTKGSLVATGGLHAGFRNIASGILTNFVQQAKKSIGDLSVAEIYVGPGAKTLEVPIATIEKCDQPDDLLNAACNRRLTEIERGSGFDSETILLDSVESTASILKKELRKVRVEGSVDSSFTDTTEDSTFHSHRIDGRHGSTQAGIDRPEAGRFVVLYHPDIRNASNNFDAIPV